MWPLPPAVRDIGRSEWRNVGMTATQRKQRFALRFVVAAVVLLGLAGCGGKKAEKPMSEADLVTQTMNSADTGSAVTAYFNCLKTVAPRTPNGTTALDLDRLEAVMKECKSQEDAMTARIADTFGKTDKPETGAARLRGLREEAKKVIRSKPYEPPSVTISGRG
jgi:hypothetical protein